MSRPAILTVVITYNGMKWVDACLGSLRCSIMPTDVFVVDNCSTDGTPEYVRAHFPEVVLVQSDGNLGFGRANNVGLKYALEHGYDYVYLLNQDARVMPDTLGRLMEAMASQPEYGVLSPVQMVAAMDKPDAGFAEKCLKFPVDAYQDGHIYEVPFVMAAHWMISRECIEAVGGFSPVFYHYGEDDNYLDRVRFKGFKVGFVAGVHAVHDREERTLTRAFRMRRKYIMALARVSDPSNHLWLRLIYQPVEMLMWSLRWFSADVLGYIPKLIACYPDLIRRRRESFNRRAFL